MQSITYNTPHVLQSATLTVSEKYTPLAQHSRAIFFFIWASGVCEWQFSV